MTNSSVKPVETSETEDKGTATHSVYNPTAIMWVFLIGLPLTLIFMILSKIGNG